MANEYRTVTVKLTVDPTGAVAGISATGRSVDGLTRKMQGAERSVTGSSRRMVTALGGIGVAVAGIGLARLVKDSVGLEAAYSKTMRTIQVATKASGREIDRLDQLAQKLGADTVFSANEAADAMLELAKGGLSPAQIEAGALQQTLTLATAGNLDLATAANAVVRGMGAYQLSARRAVDVTTALAGAANASSSDVSDLVMGLSQAGGVAHSAGLSISETAGILGLFADNALIGSDAGTSLRTMLLRLVPQTDEARKAMDELGLSFVRSNGDFVTAEQMAGRLQKAFEGKTEAEKTSYLQTIFGQDAIRGANVLIEKGAEGLRKYIKASEDRTQAEKLADAAMSGTSGALERLKGAFETAQLQIGKGLAPVVQDIADGLSGALDDWDIEANVRDIADWFVELYDRVRPLAENGLPVLVDVGGQLIEIGADLAQVLGTVVGWFGELPGPVQETAIKIGIAALAWNKLNSAVSGMRLSSFITDLASAETRISALGRAARTAAGIGGMALLVQGVGESNDALSTFELAAGGAAMGAVFGPWGAAIGGGIGLLGGLGKSLLDAADDADTATTAIGDFTDAVNELGQIDLARARREAAQAIEDSVIDGMSGLQFAKSVGIDSSTLVDAIVGSPAQFRSAEARVGDLIDKVQVKVDAAKAKAEALANDPSVGPGAALRQSQAIGERVEALQAQIDDLRSLSNVLKDNRAELGGTVAAIKRVTAATRDHAVQTKELKGFLDTLPRDFVTEISTPGATESIRDIRELGHQYDLTPRQVDTLLRLLGYDVATAQARAFRQELAQIHDKTVTITAIFQRHGQIDPGTRGAAGGRVTGGIPGRDSVPALLMPGEVVLRKRAVDAIGMDTALRLNQLGGSVTPFAEGGPVGPVVPGSLLNLDRLFGRILRGNPAATIDSVNAAFRRMKAEAADVVEAEDAMRAARSASRDAAKRVTDTEKALDKARGEEHKDKAEIARLEERLKSQRQAQKAADKDLERAESDLSRQRDQLARATAAWRQEQEELLARAEQVQQAVLAPGAAFGGDGTSVTARGFLAKLTGASDDAETFNRLLTRLRRRGLDGAVIDQIEDEGSTSAGLALAQSLASAPGSVIRAINRRQRDLERAAALTGAQAAGFPGGGGRGHGGVDNSVHVTNNFNGPLYAHDPDDLATRLEKKQRAATRRARQR